jgi:hypothetical protein
MFMIISNFAERHDKKKLENLVELENMFCQKNKEFMAKNNSAL